MTLSVLTLNIWNDDGPWKERAARIRACVDELDPDLIGFQEVLQGGGCDQLGELLGGRYQTAYARASPFWRNHEAGFGNAIASRWPIGEQDVFELPDGGDGEQRVALSATIDAPAGPISICSTHLNFRFHHGWIRERQVVALRELVLRRRPRAGFPAILVGDFNAEPESSEIRFVKGLQAIGGKSLYLRDAFAHAGEGDGITWSARNPYTHPWLEPDRRIDYVFVGGPRPDGIGAIESCRVVCDQQHEGVWPSDHFGVFCTLRTEPLST